MDFFLGSQCTVLYWRRRRTKSLRARSVRPVREFWKNPGLDKFLSSPEFFQSFFPCWFPSRVFESFFSGPFQSFSRVPTFRGETKVKFQRNNDFQSFKKKCYRTAKSLVNFWFQRNLWDTQIRGEKTLETHSTGRTERAIRSITAKYLGFRLPILRKSLPM